MEKSAMLITIWLLPATACLILLSGAVNSQPSAEVVCSDTLASTLVSELLENRAVVTESILDKFSGIILEINSSRSSLQEIYKAFSDKFARNATETGYCHFIESLNLIAAYYHEASLQSTILPESMQTILEKFNTAYGNKNSVELCDIFAKILNFKDHVPAAADEKTGVKRRQADYCERECTCPEGGINSKQLFCPCQFFSCLDEGRNLSPVFDGFEGFECLSFVLDTTGSMKDEIDATVQVIKDLTVASQELGCYMLMPFNDDGDIKEKSVGPVTLTFVDDTDPNSIKSLRRLVDNLENAFRPNSGGDCPEFCYDGIQEALNAEDPEYGGIPILVAGSQVVVVTDAPSKGISSADDLIQQANDAEVCIHFFLGQNSYNCFEESPQSVEEYERIADETGGIVVKSKFDFSTFLQKYKNFPCGMLKAENTRPKRDSVESACHNFPVASLVCVLSISIRATADETLTITRPDGKLMHVKTINYKDSSERIALFSENHPLSGEWRVCGDNPIEVSVDYQTCLDIAPFYIKNEGEKPTLTAETSTECTQAHIVIMSNRSMEITSPVLSIMDRKGDVALQTPLNKCGNSMSANITMLPSGTYFYKLAGEDNEGNPFSHIVRRKISIPAGADRYSLTGLGPESEEVISGQVVTLTFELRSTNSFGSVNFSFAIAEDISPRLVEPQRAVLSYGKVTKVNVTIRPTMSPQQVTLIATSDCSTIVSAKKTLELIQPVTTPPVPVACDPPCLNGGSCVTIRRRRREFHVCHCTSAFRGRTCETLRT